MQRKVTVEEAWQKSILSASGEHLPVNISFEKSSAMRDTVGIPGDNPMFPRGNGRLPGNNVIIPKVNVGVPMGHVGVSMDNAGIPKSKCEVLMGNVGASMNKTRIPMDNSGVPRDRGGVPLVNLEVPRGNGGLHRGSNIGIPMGNVETLRNNIELPSILYPLHLLSSQRYLNTIIKTDILQSCPNR